jgi:hypothetical protein
MLNKIFAVIVALSFILGNLNVLASEDSKKVIVDFTGLSKPYKLLNGLSIIDEIPTNASDANMPIKRGEFAEVIARLLQYDPAGSYEGIYKDVTDKTANRQAIYYLSGLKILNGKNGLFKPNNEINYLDTIKILLNILGYEAYITQMGGDTNAYLKKAQEIGLNKGIVAGINDAMTKGAMARLLFNTLNSKILDTAGISPTHNSYQQKDTFLREMFDVYKMTGIVSATEFTSLYQTEGVGKGHIEIDKLNCITDESYTSFLGYEVDAYIKNTDNEYRLVCLMPSDVNNIIELKPDDFENANTKYKLTYLVSEDKTKEMKISTDAIVIHNGRYAKDINNITLNELLLRNENGISICGDIKFIDNNNDNIYDIIVKNVYITIQVSTFNYAEGVFADKDSGESIEIDSSSSDYICRIYKNDEIVQPKAIVNGNIINLAQSYDKAIRIAYVVDTVVEGTIEEYSDNKFLIDGEWYKSSFHYNQLLANAKIKPLAVGTSGVFFLDIYGKIASTRLNAIVNQYGYLINIKKRTGLSSIVEMQMYTGKDGFEVFSVAEKVSVNGTSYSSANLIGLTDFFNGSAIIPQLLKFSVNKDNKINRILTADVSNVITDQTALNKTWYSNSDFAKNFSGSMFFKYLDPFLMGYRYSMSYGTKIWQIPSNLDEKKFAARAIEQYYLNDSSHIVDVYDSNEDMVPGLVLQNITTTEEKYTGEVMIVSKITDTIDGNGDNVTMVYGMQAGKDIKLPTSDKTVLNGVKSGDVIRYNINGRDEIYAIQMVFQYSENAAYYESDGYVINSAGDSAYTGFLQMKNKTQKTFELSKDGGKNSRMFTLYSTRIYKYNSNTGKVTPATMNDVYTIREYGVASASKIFVTAMYFRLKDIIIYE